MSARVFVFAGGGTGGHLYPGLAVAERLHAMASESVEIVFMCSQRPLDSRILEHEGVRYEVLPAQPMSVRPRGLVRFVGSWGKAVRSARAVLRELAQRGPVRMAAFGGFVAAPAVQAARVERVPVTLVNLDAVPGKASRWIARHAQSCYTVGTPVGRSRPWTSIRPIVRAQAVASDDAPTCRRAMGLEPDRPALLVTGASQGARTLNGLMLHVLRTEPAALARWQVIHQSGDRDADELRGAYESAGVGARVEPFFHEMALAWGSADAAMSRAGAGSVGEAWANRVPTVFVPYPYHRDMHQRYNAAALVEAGAAMLADDRLDPAANAQSVWPALRELLGDEGRRASMRAALTDLGPADGAQTIAQALLDVQDRSD